MIPTSISVFIITFKNDQIMFLWY